MRRLIIFILGLLIGALLMYYYAQQQEKERTMGMEVPKGVITADQAITLDRAFDTRHQLLSDSIVKREGGDNRSAWYALSEVRQYLDYAEKQAEVLGYNMDGVRIYLGAYPDTDEGVGYTTMFFVPTGKPNKAEAALFNFSLFDPGRDIPGGPGLNHGNQGYPPGANYPQ